MKKALNKARSFGIAEGHTRVRNPGSEVGFELYELLLDAVPLKDRLT